MVENRVLFPRNHKRIDFLLAEHNQNSYKYVHVLYSIIMQTVYGAEKGTYSMLTQKQKDLLMFIHLRISEKGVSPSFEEMKEALNLKSKSGIHRLITALEERGFIKRLAHRARALEIVKLPDSVIPNSAGESGSVAHGDDVHSTGRQGAERASVGDATAP